MQKIREAIERFTVDSFLGPRVEVEDMVRQDVAFAQNLRCAFVGHDAPPIGVILEHVSRCRSAASSAATRRAVIRVLEACAVPPATPESAPTPCADPTAVPASGDGPPESSDPFVTGSI